MSELLRRETGRAADPASWSDHPFRTAALPCGGEDGICAVFERRYERVALFGGVYNNSWALEALLRDAAGRGAELRLCLGDLGGFGPHPERIVPMLRSADVPTLAGNYDQSIARGEEDCGCGYTDPMDNYYAQVSYAYTLANTPDEHRRWMGRLPYQARVRVGDAIVHCCHGSPRRTNEFLWESATSDLLLSRFLAACDADLLAFTHTGVKWTRRVTDPGQILTDAGFGGSSGVADGAPSSPSGDGSGSAPRGRDGRVVNVGVLGRPENDGRTNVWYALLTADPDAPLGVDVEFVPLEYDHRTLAREMRAERLPEEFVDTIESGWWTTCLEVLPAKERSRGRH